MTYEQLKEWFIGYVKAKRNNIVQHNGKYSSREKELQDFLMAFASATGQDIEALKEATDMYKFYDRGAVI